MHLGKSIKKMKRKKNFLNIPHLPLTKWYFKSGGPNFVSAAFAQLLSIDPISNLIFCSGIVKVYSQYSSVTAVR